MNKPIALVTDIDWVGLDIEQAILETAGYEVVLTPDSSEDTMAGLVSDAAVILVCFASLPASVIARATQAKAILRYGGGVNNIDLGQASEQNIAVYNVPDFCVEEVADHALLLLLALHRGLEQQVESVRAGGWAMPHELPRRLGTQTLGLVGMGRTGQALAKRAGAMGMTVNYTMSERELPAEISAQKMDTLEELSSSSDVISLHVPLTPETRGLIDSEVLGYMKSTAVLINVARGGLVNTDDLVSALTSGTIRGAGLDVTDPEPLPDAHPLRSLPQCLVTPHFAYRSQEAIAEVRERIARAALAILQNKAPHPSDVSRVTS